MRMIRIVVERVEIGIPGVIAAAYEGVDRAAARADFQYELTIFAERLRGNRRRIEHEVAIALSA